MYNSNQYRLRMRGPFACFTRPENTAERFSYDVPTPIALEGAIEQIFWRRGMRWAIDRIAVLSPIRRMSLIRNEVKRFHADAFNVESEHTQRQTVLLRDVDYIVDVRVELLGEKERDYGFGKKCENIASRYFELGKQFSQPYFGCREMIADIRPASEDAPPPINETRSLGRMVYGYIWEGNRRDQILYFDAVMRNGVIEVPSLQEVLDQNRRVS